MLLVGHTQIDFISLNSIKTEINRNETLRVIGDSDVKFDAQKLSALSRIKGSSHKIKEPLSLLSCKMFLIENEWHSKTPYQNFLW